MPGSSHHRPLSALPCASRYGRVPFEDRCRRGSSGWVSSSVPDFVPHPATFRNIVTALRGVGRSGARITIVPRVGPAPDTVRVPVDGTDLGCVRWRGSVGAPIVVAVHGITANAWSF